jgi:hypothetical protein
VLNDLAVLVESWIRASLWSPRPDLVALQHDVAAFGQGCLISTRLPGHSAAINCSGARARTLQKLSLGTWYACSDEVGGAFGDHDGRRVGMAADDARHHRGVHHPQPIQAADAKLTIHHRGDVTAHAACSNRVVRGLGVFPDERRQLRIIDLARPGRHGRADVRAQRGRVAQPLGDAQTGDKIVQVRLGGEVAGVDNRRFRRVGTGKTDVTLAVWLQELHPQGQPVCRWRGQALAQQRYGKPDKLKIGGGKGWVAADEGDRRSRWRSACRGARVGI